MARCPFSIQIEVVLQLHVSRDGLPAARRGHKANLPRRGDCLFRQATAQSLHRANTRDLAGARKDHTQDYCAGDLSASRFFRVLRFGFEEHARPHVDFRLAKGSFEISVRIISWRRASFASTAGLISIAANVALLSRAKPTVLAFTNSFSFSRADTAAFAWSIRWSSGFGSRITVIRKRQISPKYGIDIEAGFRQTLRQPRVRRGNRRRNNRWLRNATLRLPQLGEIATATAALRARRNRTRAFATPMFEPNTS